MATPLLLFYQTKKHTVKAVTNAKKQQAQHPKLARRAASITLQNPQNDIKKFPSVDECYERK